MSYDHTGHTGSIGNSGSAGDAASAAAAAPAPPFSELLRLETRAARDKAESAAYFRLLLSGALEVHEYATLMFQYHGVHLALGRAGEALRDDPCAGPFIASYRFGVEELECDLRALLGPGWHERTYLSVAAVAYRDRVREVAASPAAFVAHHYVRYLSKLSVGQLIRAAVTHVYELDDASAGASFFALPAGTSADGLKGKYRALLDAAPWSAADRERVIDEARVAFHCNAAVTTALDNWIGSGTSVR